MSAKEGVEAVKQCGLNVRGTITAHHLLGTFEDAERDVFNVCKPVMKTPDDRLALIRVAVDGSSKFFFGSDSVPHPIQSKTEKQCAAAGCFTQPYIILSALLQYAFGPLLTLLLQFEGDLSKIMPTLRFGPTRQLMALNEMN